MAEAQGGEESFTLVRSDDLWVGQRGGGCLAGGVGAVLRQRDVRLGRGRGGERVLCGPTVSRCRRRHGELEDESQRCKATSWSKGNLAEEAC